MPGWKEAEVRRSQGAASCHPCDAPGISSIQITQFILNRSLKMFCVCFNTNFYRGRGTGLPLRGGGERRTGDCCEENLSMKTCPITFTLQDPCSYCLVLQVGRRRVRQDPCPEAEGGKGSQGAQAQEVCFPSRVQALRVQPVGA